RKAAEQEKEWAGYLFKDGSMIGLNKDILCQYIEYITNLRMETVGLPAAFPNSKSNPIPWINTWLSSDNVQVAPQETEISSYLVGQIDSDLSDSDFDDFEL
ncbi:ribonucleotide-diphosphate reductase subunit beta, partial [Psychrobacter sp.]